MFLTVKFLLATLLFLLLWGHKSSFSQEHGRKCWGTWDWKCQLLVMSSYFAFQWYISFSIEWGLSQYWSLSVWLCQYVCMSIWHKKVQQVSLQVVQVEASSYSPEQSCLPEQIIVFEKHQMLTRLSHYSYCSLWPTFFLAWPPLRLNDAQMKYICCVQLYQKLALTYH